MRTGWRRAARVAALASLSAAGLTAPAAAQTDYYNTDAGRPLRIEDAAPVERYAFELQLAPLRLERAAGGTYTWEIEPEVAYGILPRTQVEVGFPLVVTDAGGDTQVEGLAGISVSALHNLNVETSLPALAVGASVVLPVGGLAREDTYLSVKGIATRTWEFARFHVNGEYSFGPEATGATGHASRWLAGVAVDRTMPLRSLLVTAGAFAEQPLAEGAEVGWTAEAGVRYQLNPQLNVDAGVGRSLTGEQGWYATFGTAYAFAVRSLMPGRRR